MTIKKIKPLLIGVIGCAIIVILGIFTVSTFSNYSLKDIVKMGMRKAHAPNPEFDQVYGYGIDLSHHNAEPDWNNLDVDFVVLKATEGSDYLDPTFKNRHQICKDKAIPVGAYHFFTGKTQGKTEANNFIEKVGKDIDIIPIFDTERKPKGMSKKEFQKKVLDFLHTMKKHYGVLPIIYTSEGFYHAMIKNVVEKNFDEEPKLWFGDVGLNYKSYSLTPHIHQAEIKNIKGIRGMVDVNELHTKLENILK